MYLNYINHISLFLSCIFKHEKKINVSALNLLKFLDEFCFQLLNSFAPVYYYVHVECTCEKQKPRALI